MEPADLTDFTVHFKDHAFHSHTQILSGASDYFRTAIQSSKSDNRDECSETGDCEKPNHWCVKLPEELGGTDYTAPEVAQFLTLLYNPGILTTSDSLADFLESYTKSAHLAIYFDYKHLLSAFEHNSKILMSEAIRQNQHPALWNLLPLADSCRWSFLKTLGQHLVTAGSKARPSEQVALQAYKDGRSRPETMIQMLHQSMAARP